MKSPTTSVLFAGEVTLANLRDGSSVAVRVRELPARHHLELLELFHVGREADLIQRCTEHRLDDASTATASDALLWQPIDAAFVDNLTDDSHAALSELAQTLNFSRAIRTAQRQIARGQTLQPVLTAMTQAIMEPMRRELDSWTSSLTSQLSAALAEKPR